MKTVLQGAYGCVLGLRAYFCVGLVDAFVIEAPQRVEGGLGIISAVDGPCEIQPRKRRAELAAGARQT